jgi:transcriptional regulator with GAF, ATPase, and Fis domain
VAQALFQIASRALKTPGNANTACLALAKAAFQKGRPLVQTDLTKGEPDEDFSPHRDALRGLMLRSVIVLPFPYDGMVLGAVYLDSKFESSVDVEYLEDLAATVGMALHNANTITSTQRVLLHAKKLLETQKADLAYHFSYQNFIGASAKTRDLISNIRKIADSNAAVALTGESGVGKEMVAKIIHYNSSRHSEPFIAINCGAIPEGLLENELFGHERGAYTGATEYKKGLFEQAGCGTLFLDEIGELPLLMQAKILRVLEERELTPIGSNKVISVGARIICATNQTLEEMVLKGTFREDLYYRIKVISITIPSLRERKEDIPLFVDYALKTFGKENSVTPKTISPQALNYLVSYPWPGNVRELYNVIHNLSLFVEGPRIELSDIEARKQLLQGYDSKDDTKERGLHDITSRIDTGELTLPAAKAEFERLQIERALQITGGQITAAAQLLQMPRPQVSRLVKKYRITRPAP